MEIVSALSMLHQCGRSASQLTKVHRGIAHFLSLPMLTN